MMWGEAKHDFCSAPVSFATAENYKKQLFLFFFNIVYS